MVVLSHAAKKDHKKPRQTIAHLKVFQYWFLYETPYNINLFNFRLSERLIYN